jgi:hypothetical protein
LEIWYNTHPVSQKANAYRPERQARGEPHVLVSADTRKKPLFTWKDKVLNLSHLYFDIVSIVRCPVEVLELHISYFSHRDTLHTSRDTSLPSTIVENPLQISLFMQNKAKVNIGKMNISVATTKHYDKNNKQPATNVIKTNPNKAKVNMGKIDRMQKFTR